MLKRGVASGLGVEISALQEKFEYGTYVSQKPIRINFWAKGGCPVSRGREIVNGEASGWWFRLLRALSGHSQSCPGRSLLCSIKLPLLEWEGGKQADEHSTAALS